ncbi:hypothetical protein [Phenylobacterium soli]|nr:hypothetical protein [Phenylobacterium soli]
MSAIILGLGFWIASLAGLVVLMAVLMKQWLNRKWLAGIGYPPKAPTS